MQPDDRGRPQGKQTLYGASRFRRDREEGRVLAYCSGDRAFVTTGSGTCYACRCSRRQRSDPQPSIDSDSAAHVVLSRPREGAPMNAPQLDPAVAYSPGGSRAIVAQREQVVGGPPINAVGTRQERERAEKRPPIPPIDELSR